nr:MAG TPA: hypothetical protein [Caudoviricetes sp.]
MRKQKSPRRCYRSGGDGGKGDGRYRKEIPMPMPLLYPKERMKSSGITNFL